MRSSESTPQTRGLLEYYIESASKTFSLNPLDVDNMTNDVLMRTLVATLLRTDRSHRRVPYLAQSWATSADQKIWTFHLHPGLKCEDGTPLTAQGFALSLHHTLAMRAKLNPKVTVFSRAIGWDEFVAGKAMKIRGIRSPNDVTLEFEFSSPMDIGVLAFFSLPQFGYYCEGNFTVDGKFKQTTDFISSGAYSLKKLSGGLAQIVARKDWPLHSAGAPHDVHLIVEEKVDFAKPLSENIFVVKNGALTEKLPNGFTASNGAMTWLRSLVVTPHMKNIFSIAENRRHFQDRLVQWQARTPLNIPGAAIATAFYPSSVQRVYPTFDSTGYVSATGSSTNLTLIYSAPEEVIEHYLPGIQYALEGSGVQLTVKRLDRTNSVEIEKFLSNRDYDLRLISSSIGAGISSWIVDMMFCSNLGVSFPDPSGRICELVNREKTIAYDETEFSRSFNKTLAEDAAVIPLHHTGATWVFGPGVSSEDISPLSPVPGIEQLSLK